MPATCAACSLAIRKGDGFKVSGCYLLHVECTRISVDQWDVHQRHRDLLADRAHETLRLERALSLTKSDLERVQLDRDQWKRRADDLRSIGSDLARHGDSTQGYYQSLVAERDERVNQLERQVQRLQRERRDLIAQIDAEPLGRQVVGLAVGRGIWGLAFISAKVALEKLDDSEARFSLLEL